MNKKRGYYGNDETDKMLEIIRKHDLRENISDTIRYLAKRRVKEIKEEKNGTR